MWLQLGRSCNKFFLLFGQMFPCGAFTSTPWRLFVSSSAVQQPDPNQPRPEGAEMMPVRGEALGVVTNWPPSLEAALQRWGTISPKAPCLTSLDTAGKPLYVLTYGKKALISWFVCLVLSGRCPRIVNTWLYFLKVIHWWNTDAQENNIMPQKMPGLDQESRTYCLDVMFSINRQCAGT